MTSQAQITKTRAARSKQIVLHDYRIAHRSRQASIIARQEVFAGKAKFGVFGDGKEIPQIALAHAFHKGDFRSGYYRDQTLMFALDLLKLEEFFAQLYAHTDLAAEPFFGGRAMTGHFATRLLKDDGSWKNQLESYNSAADLSPTAAQMPRLVGLALASKIYRHLGPAASFAAPFSDNGNEIAFGTIGNAACAEGAFWEVVNAIGVLQAPALLSIWDDGYGISVPNDLQVTKGDHARLLVGFQPERGNRQGIEIYRVRGWDYPRLCDIYLTVSESVRLHHVPAIVHVTELTQPQGHSTSGSHERYKSRERLKWEREFDCLRKMREWILQERIASPADLNEIEAQERNNVIDARDRAWKAFRAPIETEREDLMHLVEKSMKTSANGEDLRQIMSSLEHSKNPARRDLMTAAEDALIVINREEMPEATHIASIASWMQDQRKVNSIRYDSHLYSETSESALSFRGTPALYLETSPVVQGFEILNQCFARAFDRYPQLLAMGEDVGRLGGVNQGFVHLQEKHGPLRVMDTGIRETTIIGQAIGLALRGFKPIAEIQYLDYLLYAIQIMSDDLASLRWRTHGGQKAPVIIRTRGHRLEGIWHSGSPMAGIINYLRGIYVCVPRDATQAAGFYNTLFRSDDPAIVVEVLNAYRLKAKLPENIADFALPLGRPEIIREGEDVTIATYGACCAVAEKAADRLQSVGINVEIIDVRTLLPFDLEGCIVRSIQKTNRILFLDEDCPGGATAYMMQKVLEEQGGYSWLDCAPRTLTAKEHRPAYGSDGDYFSKPNADLIFEAVYGLMHESDPRRFAMSWGNRQ